jgi:hypothetical protein
MVYIPFVKSPSLYPPQIFLVLSSYPPSSSYHSYLQIYTTGDQLTIVGGKKKKPARGERTPVTDGVVAKPARGKKAASKRQKHSDDSGVFFKS